MVSIAGSENNSPSPSLCALLCVGIRIMVTIPKIGKSIMCWHQHDSKNLLADFGCLVFLYISLSSHEERGKKDGQNWSSFAILRRVRATVRGRSKWHVPLTQPALRLAAEVRQVLSFAV